MLCKNLDAVNTDEFVKFELTDSGVLILSKGNYLVLTDDLKLANYLQSVEIDMINFNNIRLFNW